MCVYTIMNNQEGEFKELLQQGARVFILHTILQKAFDKQKFTSLFVVHLAHDFDFF